MKIQSKVKELPSRPKPAFKYQSIQLRSNCCKINIFATLSIHSYFFSFQPSLPADARGQKQTLIDNFGKRITQYLGPFVISGWTIYSNTCLQSRKSIKLDQNYTIILQKKNSFDLSRDQTQTLYLLKALMKACLRGLGLQEIGRQSKFFDFKAKQNISGTGMQIRTGFQCSVNRFRDGFFMRINPALKISRKETAKDYIDMIYHIHSKQSRQRIREIVQEKMQGKSVMVTYGNQRYYRIEQVQFGLDPCEYFLDQAKTYSLFEYYKKVYRIEIKNRKAPLISVRSNKKNFKTYLIAELCVMTGLPQDCDDSLRKSISGFTIKDPESKNAPLSVLVRKLQKDNGSICLNSIREKLGIEFRTDFQSARGGKLNVHQISLGRGDKIDPSRVNGFQIFDKELYFCKKEIQVILIHFDANRSSLQTMQQIILKTSKNFNLRLNYKQRRLSRGDGNQIIEIVEEYSGKGKHQAQKIVVLALLPNNLKPLYSKIKKASLCTYGITTQIILESTCNRKGLPSIITKLLIQIAVKAGNSAWNPRCFAEEQTMMIGIDSYKDKINPSKTVVSMVSTTSRDFSTFYSNISYQDRSLIFFQQIDNMVCKAIQQYYTKNQTPPKSIVLFRTGMPDNQFNSIVQQEINKLTSLFPNIHSQYSPGLAFIVTDRKPPLKLYMSNSGRLQNPPAGSFLNQKLVQNYSNFYLISQRVGRGSANPVHFKILVNTTNMCEEQLIDLAYQQCYNYMNWSGPIKVPSVLQYASKLSKFQGEHLGQQVHERLKSRLFYL